MTKQVHAVPTRPNNQAMPDDGLVMLEEVDFKWLMAGQVCWIDTDRLHSDPSYATHLLDQVETTQSVALKDCAALLRAQVGIRH